MLTIDIGFSLQSYLSEGIMGEIKNLTHRILIY